MPRAPILSREGFYHKVHGVIVLNDWCLVNTKLGAMIEQRPGLLNKGGPFRELDTVDNGFDRLTEMDPGYLKFIFGTGGDVYPVSNTP